jgi:hypothetical protein
MCERINLKENFSQEYSVPEHTTWLLELIKRKYSYTYTFHTKCIYSDQWRSTYVILEEIASFPFLTNLFIFASLVSFDSRQSRPWTDKVRSRNGWLSPILSSFSLSFRFPLSNLLKKNTYDLRVYLFFFTIFYSKVGGIFDFQQNFGIGHW